MSFFSQILILQTESYANTTVEGRQHDKLKRSGNSKLKKYAIFKFL